MNRLTFAALFTLTPQSLAVAQLTLRIADVPSCRECQISLQPDVRLGTNDGDGILEGEPSSITRTNNGVWVITQFSPPGRAPLLFDSSGTFIRVLGRVGAGPGEFQHPLYSVAVNESLYVNDLGNARLNVYGPDLAFVRSAQSAIVGQAYPFTMTKSGHIVANAIVQTRAAIGHPLHLFSGELEYIQAFGGGKNPVMPGTATKARRRLFPSQSGGVWAAHTLDHIVELYDSHSKLVRRLEGPAVSTPAYIAPSKERPPFPMTMGVAEDTGAVLWILRVVADRRWASAVGTRLPQRLGGGSSPIAVVEKPDLYHDTILEAVDSGTGRLIARRRFDEQLGFLVSPGYVANRVEDAAGRFFVQTWRFALSTSSQRR